MPFIYASLAVGLVDALLWGIFVQPQVYQLADQGATAQESFTFFSVCVFWLLLLDMLLLMVLAIALYRHEQKRDERRNNEQIYARSRDGLRLADDTPHLYRADDTSLRHPARRPSSSSKGGQYAQKNRNRPSGTRRRHSGV